MIAEDERDLSPSISRGTLAFARSKPPTTQAVVVVVVVRRWSSRLIHAEWRLSKVPGGIFKRARASQH